MVSDRPLWGRSQTARAQRSAARHTDNIEYHLILILQTRAVPRGGGGVIVGESALFASRCPFYDAKSSSAGCPSSEPRGAPPPAILGCVRPCRRNATVGNTTRHKMRTQFVLHMVDETNLTLPHLLTTNYLKELKNITL